jgi:hypothetical protein
MSIASYLITFFSSGTNEVRTLAYFFKLFYDFLETDRGMKIDLAPNAMAELASKVGQ